jgi:hypothetical protein
VEERGPDRVLLVRWCERELHLLVPRAGSHHPGDELRPRLDAERAVVWEGGGDGAGS